MIKLAIVFLIGTTWTSVAEIFPPPYTCDPDIDCKARKVGAMVPDVNDCEKYYFCVKAADGSPTASTIPLSCPVGTYFSDGSCIAGRGPCINKCRTDGVCATTCPDTLDDSFAANNYDCSKYTLCSTVLGVVNTTCAGTTPYFNGVGCVDNPVQCCDFCTPYCLDVGLEIQDPCDCTSFYVCREVGKPSDNTRGTCPEGFYYNEATNSCASGSCTSLCSGEGCVVAQSSTTTIPITTKTSSAAFRNF